MTDDYEERAVIFRKCWALGEAYYYLENYYSDFLEECNSNNTNSENIRQYVSQMIALMSICKGFGFPESDTEKIEGFVKSLNPGLNDASGGQNGQISINKEFDNYEPDFRVELESYLVGNLIGKDLRYNHIFRTAKHSLELYKIDDELKQKFQDNEYGGKKKGIKSRESPESQEILGNSQNKGGVNSKNGDSEQNDDSNSRFGNFLKDLEYMRNFISRDKIHLIRDTVNDWENVQERYIEHKSKLLNGNKNVTSSKLDISNIESGYFKNPELAEVINKIGGLITGSLEIYDILNRWDRFWWGLLTYGLLAVVIIAILLIIYFIGILLLDVVLKTFSQFVTPKTGSDISAYLTAFTMLVGGLFAFLKTVENTVKPNWMKYKDKIALQFALNRLKNPESLGPNPKKIEKCRERI